jgi:transcriptional regulator with XRE-family HTH domain
LRAKEVSVTKQGILEKIKRTNHHDNIAFSFIIESILESKIWTVRELADGLRVSHPTVERWAKGKSLPHVVMIPLVYAYLSKRLTHDIFLEDLPARIKDKKVSNRKLFEELKRHCKEHYSPDKFKEDEEDILDENMESYSKAIAELYEIRPKLAKAFGVWFITEFMPGGQAIDLTNEE